MTSIAIMQPTFLPWVGYFALMDSVDHFVFLDHVQFDKRSWQQRNQVKTTNGATWLSVPVDTKGKRDQSIKDVKINGEDFPKKIIKTIEHNYTKAPFYNDYADSVFTILKENSSSLLELNTVLIGLFCQFLKINPKISYSSDLSVSGQKSSLLVDICRHYDAIQYVSPPGSRTYIEEEGVFEVAGIPVQYFDYEHPNWPQLYGEFLPYMSIIDLIFNTGDDASDIIRLGLKS